MTPASGRSPGAQPLDHRHTNTPWPWSSSTRPLPSTSYTAVRAGRADTTNPARHGTGVLRRRVDHEHAQLPAAYFRQEYAVINLRRLTQLEGDNFDFDRLKELGAVKKLQAGLKVLGTGEVGRAIHVTAHSFSESARQKIEAAGGTTTLVSGAAAETGDNQPG